MPERSLLQRFAASSARHADRVIPAADRDRNGAITHRESAGLGDMKDTYDLYAEATRPVRAGDFLAFYKAYTRVAARLNELPRDLRDNYRTWLEAQTAREPAAFETAARRAGKDFVQFIMQWRSGVASYYETGDEAYYAADEQRVRAYFEAATFQETPVPPGYEQAPNGTTVAMALQVVNPNDPDDVIDGEVMLLFNAAAKLVNIVYRTAGQTYDRTIVS